MDLSSKPLINFPITNSLKSMIQGQIYSYRELMAYYNCAMMEVATKFNVLNEELSLQYDRNPIEAIKTRLKSTESIAEKLKRRGVSFPITAEKIEQELTDIAGVRVICSYPTDIYLLSEAFLRQDDVVLIQKKDYIANPKPNGYRSLHIVVNVPVFLSTGKEYAPVEIQIRTMAMDFWASLEHELHYKTGKHVDSALEDELYYCAETIAETDRRMQNIYKSINTANSPQTDEKSTDENEE